MPEALIDPAATPLTSGAGLRATINANGSVRRFDCDPVSLTLFVGNEVEGGPTNLYLRRFAQTVEWTPLLGPLSPTRFHTDPASGRLMGVGTWMGINYWITLVLAQSVTAWFWHVRLENTHSSTQTVDLTYTQDLALAPYGAVRLNEYYVGQYIDHTPLPDAVHGIVLASRQNQAVDGRYPWCLIGSLRETVSYATDAAQFHGLATRAGAAPVGLTADLPGRRLQQEHSMVVLRDASLRLDPGGSATAGFFGSYLADHPEATATSDLERVSAVLALPEATPVAAWQIAAPVPPVVTVNPTTLFSSAPLLDTLDLDTPTLKKLFASPWRHEELDGRGKLLSFFYGADRHVALREKEFRVQRPHGHLLRTGRHTTPDESALTSTAWMSGVFHSMVTQGHVSINRFLSTVHTYLGLFRSHGQRVFVEVGGGWQLLNVPAAFEMSPAACRWIYRHAQGVIEVSAAAHSNPHELTLSIEVSSGKPRVFSSRITWLSTTTTAALAARHSGRAAVPISSSRPRPAAMSRIGFPTGPSLSRRCPAPSFSKSAATSCCFSTGGHASSRLYASSPHPLRRLA